MGWLERVTSEVAAAVGLDPETLAVPPEDARVLLELARIASHASGDRINAPLLCYALGKAAASGAPLEDLSTAVRAAAEESSG